MALYSSGTQIADVALTDTFNTWRTRFNQTVADGASTSANNTFNAIQTFSGTQTFSANTTHNAFFTNNSQINANKIAATGLVSAPTFNANNIGGTLTTAAQGNITSVGALNGGSITSGFGSIDVGSSSIDGGTITADTSFVGTLGTAAQPNITSVGTLTSLTSSGTIQGATVTSTGALNGQSLSITQNAVITGNLTVNGTTTTVNSNTVEIGDNILVLNSDETGTPSQDGGIEIERGTSSNKTLIWDESEDYWSVGSETFNAGALQSTTASIGTLTITDNIKFNNFMREEVSISATAATGTINYNVKDATVVYYTTNASGNWTLNIRGDASTTLNSLMSTGESISLVFAATQGGTAYYNSTFQIDGSGVTPKWLNDSAPSAGTANGIDAYNYSIIKTGDAAFTVLASVSAFG